MQTWSMLEASRGQARWLMQALTISAAHDAKHVVEPSMATRKHYLAASRCCTWDQQDWMSATKGAATMTLPMGASASSGGMSGR